MNILIKLMSIVSLIIAPHISVRGEHDGHDHTLNKDLNKNSKKIEVVLNEKEIKNLKLIK